MELSWLRWRLPFKSRNGDISRNAATTVRPIFEFAHIPLSMAIPLVPKLRERLSAISGMRRGRPRSQSRRQVVLELLENRLAPAVVLWDGGPGTTGTNWNDPVNWAGDVLPGATDDAEIGIAFAGITVTSSGNVTIRGVASAAAL